MNKIFIALILTFSTASVSATTWPWEEAAPKQPPEYCKGFVVGGLASDQVSGMSRTDLWLAWSYVIRSGALDHNVAADEFQAGREKFQNVADNAAAASIVQSADGNCGLGRSGLQITGW
jgi:hypothetical protein